MEKKITRHTGRLNGDRTCGIKKFPIKTGNFAAVSEIARKKTPEHGICRDEGSCLPAGPVETIGFPEVRSMEYTCTEIKNSENSGDEKSRITGMNPSYSLGIDIGYSSVKVALVDDFDQVVYTTYALHKGKIREQLYEIFKEISGDYDTRDIVWAGIAGNESRFLSELLGENRVGDVPALIEGSRLREKDVRSIIEIGGEGSKYITGIGDGADSSLEISMNSNCSAGTGSFLEEQVSRLDLDIGDYAGIAAGGKSIPRIAGRCAVFAKTDIIHHQQEGVPVEDILQGLAYALVKNYRSSVIKKLPIEAPVLFAGGVALNGAIVKAIKEVLKTDDNGLIVPEDCGNITAIGAALIAKREKLPLNFMEMADALKSGEGLCQNRSPASSLPRLDLFGSNDATDMHLCKTPESEDLEGGCFFGVDIGSTSTNLVIIDSKGEIIAYRYLRTLGDPVRAVVSGLGDLGAWAGSDVKIAGAGITGSGRYMIARLIGADVIKDEITAQAKAASAIDGSVDTVFEIGGQDSKYISLNEGRVTDFQMNKICAAGTGSFIEEQSKKFDIPLDNFGDIALQGENPVNLGERCTVFIETSVASHLAEGTPVEDIVSGLCYSIASNYLNRVVGRKKIGNRIFLQGGIAYNQGVVNAFRSLTGKEVFVPPFFSVTGAYGAALLAKEDTPKGESAFKGFSPENYLRTEETDDKSEESGQQGPDFSDMVGDIIFEGYDGSIDENRKTIGMPRALFTYGMYPMFTAFFRELGYNVVLSDPTNEETIRLAQEYSLDETCYPVKLVNGHIAELVEKGVDYIFFPDLYTVVHPGSHSRENFGCPYMQLAFKLVNRAMELDKKGIKLLSPTIGFSLGEEFMKKSFMDLGRQLGRSPEETGRAMQKGMKAIGDFEERTAEKGREIVRELRPDEKAFVLISKIYGVADPVLNLGIPDALKKMGYKVLAFYNLPEGDTSGEHPNMFWPFGQHILEAAQIVRSHPNLYAIFLTHHGCGPDTVFTHYFREIMGDKPYLNIEVDEHSSDVGVITRLEAFVNSLDRIPQKNADDMSAYPARIVHKDADIITGIADLPGDVRIYIPWIYPYSLLFCEFVRKYGLECKVIPKTGEKSLEAGRKHTMTNEYFSMTALIGDVLSIPEIREPSLKPKYLLIPQSEGAEVDGQYSRMVRTVLDRENLRRMGIISPFIEDVIRQDRILLDKAFLLLVAGDLVLAAHPGSRDAYLEKISGMIRDDKLNIESLLAVSEEITKELNTTEFKGTVFAAGEISVLYNDYLNNFTFKKIEDEGYRVIYAPLGECMWQFWTDIMHRKDENERESFQPIIDVFEGYISDINSSLGKMSPYDDVLTGLIERADDTIGYYDGAFGRYRESKILGDLKGADGIITVASLYENTAVTLNSLHKGFTGSNKRPVLNLSFDGNDNENDENRIESFLYYLGRPSPGE